MIELLIAICILVHNELMVYTLIMDYISLHELSYLLAMTWNSGLSL